MPAHAKPAAITNPVLKASLVGLFVFLLVIAATGFLTYQQYRFQKNKNREELQRELNHVKERFLSILYADIDAANSIAVIFKEYGIPKNFEGIAAQLMQYHRKVEMINLAVDGVITNAYPYEENKTVIGIKLFDNPLLEKETLRAQEKKEIFFAGPRELIQGGVGILGKVPVIKDNKLKALVTVLTRLETIRKALEVDASAKNRFAYLLIKTTPDSDIEQYYLTEARPSAHSPVVTATIPEGDWELRVAYSTDFTPTNFPYLTALMGFLFALFSAIVAGRTVYSPYLLHKIIAAKTSEIAAKEKYFRTLIETSTDAIVLVDPEANVIYQTPSAARISGYSLNEIQNLDSFMLVHPHHREMSQTVFENVREKAGEKAIVKLKMKHKNGSYIWIEGTYRNLLQEESVKAIVFNYVDITDRIEDEWKLKITRRKLKERIKELSTIFKVSTIFQDETQKISAAFTKMAELLPTGWQYAESCEAKIEFDGKAYLSKGFGISPFRQAVTFTIPDGRSGSIEIVYTKPHKPAFEGPFLKEERELLNTLAEMTRVYLTRKFHQETLTQSEARFRGAFEFSAIGMALVSLTGKFQKVNKALCDITGYTADELLNLTFQQATHPADLEKTSVLMQETLDGKTDYFRKEMRFYHKNGSVIWINLSAAPVRDNHNAPVYFVSQIENITRRKNLEQERHHMFTELIGRNKKMEEFAAIVSHNLRAPLSNILGLAGMFEEELHAPKENAIISGIKTSAENLDEVVKELNQILYYQTQFTEKHKTVNLAELLEEVIKPFRPEIEKTGAQVTCNFSAAPEVISVRSFLQNIFANLLSNSLKFQRANVPPEIKIWSAKEPDKTLFYFQDNGLGIDLEKYGNQIFRLNKRFHPTITGLGLGLFMVKAQVDSLNGTITVNSTPNQGTTFIITLPVS